MTPSLGSFSAIFSKGALRAVCRSSYISVPEAMPPTSTSGVHWRTLARQPCVRCTGGVYTLFILVATRSGDKRHLWKEVSSAAWKPGGWATQAAALAARIQFKHWVDFERNAKKRAAQSESVASRASAALDALLQTPEPTRVSGRKRPRHARVGVGLKVIGGKVQLGLALAEIMPDGSPGPDELIQYHSRSAGSLQRVRKRRKRELDIKYGLHAVSCESEVLWSDVIARCHAEAMSSRCNVCSILLFNLYLASIRPL